jgi:hypothetical protein
MNQEEVSQSIKSGDNSVINQVINNGPSIQEIELIVRAILAAEFEKYRSEALETVNARIEYFESTLMAALEKTDTSNLESMRDPDNQMNLITATKGFARSGDETLADILVNLLMKRFEAENQSVVASVLNDAIEVASKLTRQELAILSLHWRLTRTVQFDITNLDSIAEYFQKEVLPFIDDFKGTPTYVHHLEYLSLLFVEPFTGSKFGSILASSYPGIYTQGFEASAVPEVLQAHISNRRVFIPCLRNQSKLQINASSAQMVENLAKETKLEDHVEVLQNLLKYELLAPEEIEKELSAIDPKISTFIQQWNKSDICRTRLSPVGIAIAHANYRRLNGLAADLNIWITD